MNALRKLSKRLQAQPGRKIALKNFNPASTAGLKDKTRAKRFLAENTAELVRQQNLLYAQDTYSVLLIFQAMDAAGKDGAIRHVMSGINPQGCQVFSFKAPSAVERDHTYLWRSMRALPERGRIGIHNRSYYEEVLVPRVREEVLVSAQLPEHMKDQGIWKRRFREINNFEHYLASNGMLVLKFFLHVSKAEQKRRFLERIDEDDKNWKFSSSDVKERAHWDNYMHAYESIFTHTSTKTAPWHIVPADNKWFTRLAVSSILVEALQKLNLSYPVMTKAKREGLAEARRILMAEKD